MGCDKAINALSPTTVGSSGTANEELVVSETARFARLLNVKVGAQLTDYQYHVGTSLAAAWYVGTYGKGAKGTAYYYQPYIPNLGNVVNGAYWESVTNVAGHETCHAETGAPHDHAHWACMARVASPTYLDPGVGIAQNVGICGLRSEPANPGGIF
jgi:hypothetical protein